MMMMVTVVVVVVVYASTFFKCVPFFFAFTHSPSSLGIHDDAPRKPSSKEGRCHQTYSFLLISRS